MVDREAQTASRTGEGPGTAARSTPGLVRVLDATGALTSEVFRIGESTTIGRGEGCTILVDDSQASRAHARVVISSTSSHVEDLESRHGTWVNGTQVSSSDLQPGDVLVIGSTVFLFVEDSEEAAPFTPTPALANFAMVGSSWLRRVATLAARFGPSALTLLILGETGTGKEGVVDLLHRSSKRPGQLVAVNCAAIPRELAEAQLFGYKRGAFSGAVTNNDGLFALAANGTLFLDEIGDLPMELQAKLLRVLETGDYMPVGSTTTMRSTARVVAAASRDLRKDAESERFRPDLYHRLAGIEVLVPPLRERPEEIPLMLAGFLKDAEGVKTMSADALVALLRYPFPGNVRELKRIAKASALRAEERQHEHIKVQDLGLEASPSRLSRIPPGMTTEAQEATTSIPPAVARASSAPPKGPTKAAPTVEEVQAALRDNGGNVSKAAAALSVHRAQIYRVLKEHGISSDAFRDE